MLFLINDPSPVGLFVLADLDPLWFTGLPFNAQDVDRLRNASNKQMGLDQKYKPQPAWSTGEIAMNWHESDDLVTEKSMTAEGVREWLLTRLRLHRRIYRDRSAEHIIGVWGPFSGATWFDSAEVGPFETMSIEWLEIDTHH